MFSGFSSGLNVPSPLFLAPSKPKLANAPVSREAGKVISFGYNSAGMGKINGFEITRILIVNHGGDHYDTICTVSKKSFVV